MEGTILKKVLLSEKEEVREVRAESQEEGRSPDGVVGPRIAFEGDVSLLQAKQGSFWKWRGGVGAALPGTSSFGLLPYFTSLGVLGGCERS